MMLTGRQRNWLVGIGLFLGTMVLFWPATHFPFVNYDDQLYVYENPVVMKGLSWAGIQWVMFNVSCNNWHPLTMISHMLDCSLFGTFSGGHHLTSLLLHALNALLLWQLLTRLTGQFWPSALVAALFAWHPLNVESVAWVAERKNLLSTFFFILTVWAYWRYAQENSRARWAAYFAALMFFILGLAAKPMLVTLPCLLLLLDFWPLNRIPGAATPSMRLRQLKIWSLLFEKLPFFLLSAADCIITFAAQSQTGAVRTLAEAPVDVRLMNVPVAYATYLGKTFWPVNLCVFYPFPATLALGTVMIAALFLVVPFAVAWRLKSKFPWLLVGWLWFLGMLIPVIGLIKVGEQSLADRYAYLPLIGIFLILACLIHESWRAWPSSRFFWSLLIAGFLVLCLIQTRRQLAVWQDSVSLFSRVAAINPNNAYAHTMLARALSMNNRRAEAIEHYAIALRLNPDDGELKYDLGREEMEAGKIHEAGVHLQSALQQMPEDHPVLRNTYGVVLMMEGQPDAARKEFARAIELQPDYPKPHFNLGKLSLSEGDPKTAIIHLARAAQLQPDWAEAFQYLARAQAANGDMSNAVQTAKQALKLAQAVKQPALAGQISTELTSYQKGLNPQ